MQKARAEKIRNEVFAIVERHKRALIRKKFQTLREDDYGKKVYEPWGREINYFMEKVVDPEIKQSGFKEYEIYQTMRPALLLTIARQIENDSSSDGFTMAPNVTPTDYEQYCAQRLRNAGWRAGSGNLNRTISGFSA